MHPLRPTPPRDPSPAPLRAGLAVPSASASPDDLRTALGVAGAGAALVLLGSRLLPVEHAGTLVALTFLGLTWWRVWSRDEATIERHGLRLGGLFDREGMRWGPALRALAGALRTGGLTCLLTFPPFILGWLLWFQPWTHAGFALTLPSLWDDVLSQVLLVALPEEVFFRGYLQPCVESHFASKPSERRPLLTRANLLTSALFAFGHLLTSPHPARLAVFFPSLLFGILRERTGTLGSSITYHAACNLLSGTLARSWLPRA